jgi:hypothetical protein
MSWYWEGRALHRATGEAALVLDYDNVSHVYWLDSRFPYNRGERAVFVEGDGSSEFPSMLLGKRDMRNPDA